MQHLIHLLIHGNPFCVLSLSERPRGAGWHFEAETNSPLHQLLFPKMSMKTDCWRLVGILYPGKHYFEIVSHSTAYIADRYLNLTCESDFIAET